MFKFRFYASILTVGLMALGAAGAQDFPNRPIRILTGDVGGATDLTSRIIAQGLSENFGQQVIVDNRGGSGLIPGVLTVKAAPTGYTLLITGSSIWLSQFLQEDVPFDPIRDFAPVMAAVSAPNILVVNPSMPVKSVKELIELAKTKPGTLNYGSGSTGAPNHLAAELFKRMAGVNIPRIPYKGTGPALVALIAGEVQLAFPNAGSVSSFLKSGKVRALGIASAQPSPLFPGLPTISASGVPGYESTAVYGIFAPAQTPAAVITRLNQELVRVLRRPAVMEKFADLRIDIIASTPAQLTNTVQNEINVLGKMIKEVGIRLE